MQAVDYVSIGRKKYILIDVEKGKQIITCADFPMPEHFGEISHSTACWRGYTADYYIIRNILHGIKRQEICFDGTERIKGIKSLRTIIPYTGSCIIAYGDAWNSDFLESFIDYDEAFELYFENGVLREKLTLKSAIEKFKDFEKSNEYDSKMEPCERADMSEQIAWEALKYKYDKHHTYKWRKNKGNL